MFSRIIPRKITDEMEESFYNTGLGFGSFGNLKKYNSVDSANLIPKAFNNQNTKILLTNGTIANTALGKGSTASITNTGTVIVGGSGNFEFSGSNYLIFNNTGFDFSKGRSWVLDFYFSDTGTGRADFAGAGIDALYSPSFTKSVGGIRAYISGLIQADVLDNQSVLYTAQYDAENNIASVWLNGELIGVNEPIFNPAFYSYTIPYRVGLFYTGDGGAFKLKYFRATNGTLFNPYANFTPNTTGV